MLPENDENKALKPKDLVFILAIAGRIDAQSRLLAQKLDNDRYIYYAYAALDSLNTSYSMYKYFFEILATNTGSDRMHEDMLTPGSIAAITIESIFLVTFSVLACKFDGEKNDAIKKLIASAWPYFRDITKGLKNAYKGWRSTMQTISTLSGVDLRHMIIPFGLVLGIFAASNRLWLRYMVEKRKQMMGDNAALLIEIKQLITLNHEYFEFYLKKIQYQSTEVRYAAFVAVAAGGFVDGLYLYIGVLSLATLSPPVFIVMVALSAIFTLACVVTRVYEEYDFQTRLFITQTKCKLGLITKEIEFSYEDLLTLKESTPTDELTLAQFQSLQTHLAEMLNQFEKTRHVLRQQSTRSFFNAGLLGLKNGLYAYSALASVVFFIGTIITLSSAAFPPALLIVCVCLGATFMIGFVIHSLWANSQKVSHTEPPGSTYNKLTKMRDSITNDEQQITLLTMADFKQSLKDGLTLNSSPQNFYQEWLEVIRSFFSGLGKGQKFVDFAFNPLQEMDDQGHYRDTPVMFVLGAVGAAIFSLVLALRAFARGLGRPPLGQVDLAADIKPEKIQEKPEQEGPNAAKFHRDHKHSKSILDTLGLFKTNTPIKTSITHSKSSANFAEEPRSSILGLM